MDDKIITIRERKAIAAQARASAASRIASALSDHARHHNGRYILFGSAARGNMRHDSDIDLLVDFPPHLEGDAIRFAEALCAAECQPCDVLTIGSRDPAFLERALKDSVELS